MATNASESDTDSTDTDETIYCQSFGKPHEAKYEEWIKPENTDDGEGGKWVPLCHRHVDPTEKVREL